MNEIQYQSFTITVAELGDSMARRWMLCRLKCTDPQLFFGGWRRASPPREI